MVRRSPVAWWVALTLSGLAGLPAHAAVTLHTIDGRGKIREAAAAANAAPQRTPPAALRTQAHQPSGDPDALQYMLAGDFADFPSTLEFLATDTTGKVVDRLANVALHSIPCPKGGPGPSCAATLPIRLSVARPDAAHPLVANRSLVAHLGNTLWVETDGGQTLGRLIVGPYRDLTARRHVRANLRIRVVRNAAKRGALLARGASEATSVVRKAVGQANALWGVCGLSFGPVEAADIKIVDPPKLSMLVVGCDHGLPASGGELNFRVGSRNVTVKSPRGIRPQAMARRIAQAARKLGLTVDIFDNSRIGAGAYGTADLIFRNRVGRAVPVRPSGRPLSTDRSLTACVSTINLNDGLQHFGDVDAKVGTREERTLIRAFDDRNPATIEVIVVPGFGQGGRIGESFINSDGGTIRNVVLLDRVGIRADGGAATLAHELGHVLLDEPGHPDDHGSDLPQRLMDADASDRSAFGPLHVTPKECRRVRRRNGAKNPTPLLK